jgi:PadR family transcriptional regulator, regulatory protein AphA
MDLRDTLLGLLSSKPSSGYDLKRNFFRSVIYYWSGNNNQIYKNLIKLEKEGLITYQVQTQKSLPAKKVYSITDNGSSELHQSLLAAPEVPELRKGFLIQLTFAEILTDEEILTLLGKYEDEIADLLRDYQAQAEKLGKGPYRSKREKYLWKRIGENIIATYQTELDWVRQTQQEFPIG